METQTTRKPRRGRPPARSYSIAEASDLLAIPPASLRRAIAAEIIKADGDRIRQADLAEALDVKRENLPRLLTVKAFAELTGFSRQWIYDLISVGTIDSRRVLGKLRIPETAYWNLPEVLPAEAPTRPDLD